MKKPPRRLRGEELQDELSEESELCQACGMCCDGTLYTHVVLTDDEVLALKKYPELKLTVRNYQPALLQGCSQHSAAGCGIYKDRPSACSRYHCALASDLLDGEISLPEALAIVQESKALVENATSYAPPAPGQPVAIATWEATPVGLSAEGALAWDRAKEWINRHSLGPMPS